MLKSSVALSVLLGLLGLSAVVNLTFPQAGTRDNSDKATPVREGDKTDKDRFIGSRFQRHKTGRKLSEETAHGAGEIVIKSIIYPPFIGAASNCPTYPSQFLTSYAHQADAIIIGSLTGKSYSQLTEADDFIFSVYSVAVDEVIKNNPGTSIEREAHISVVRPGGEVILNGRKVRAIAGRFLPFQVNQRYLFFLKFIPETGDYQAFGNGTFLLDRDKALGLERNEQTLGDVTSFLNGVRDATSAKPCANHSLY
ncbi:MAG TPA: hypothetical protein VEY09_17680 [Pyrinomonadaceae bacterium]|nr:hypothetical protein [Pyrinomonadaceae bacterium]